MPRYIIKLSTYDPAIIQAFERLGKTRKKAAFTHEALKYFLTSQAGSRVMDLMNPDHSSLSSITPPVKGLEQSENIVAMPPMISTGQSSGSAQDLCSGILGKILE